MPPKAAYLRACIVLFAEKYSWKGSLLIQGAITLNSVVCATLLRPFPQKQTSLVPSSKDKISMEVILRNTDNVATISENMKEDRNDEDNKTKSGGNETSTKRIQRVLYEYTGCIKQTVLCDSLISIGCLFAFSGHAAVLSMVALRADEIKISKTNVSILYAIFGATSGIFRYVNLLFL